MVESDTWEGRENLVNTKEAIKEFKKEYRCHAGQPFRQ